MSIGKRFKKIAELVEPDKFHSFDEGFKILLETATAKFDESVEVAIKLGVDAKQSDQQVRGAVPLPNGLGKNIRVIVFAKGEKLKAAEDAGADLVGSDELVEKIKGGWLDFDKVIATPDLMSTVAKVAKVLGPRGLMPSPKVGTVTQDVAKAVQAEKQGKLSFRVEKAGIIHVIIGRKSLGEEKLKENYKVFLETIIKAKPSSSKGVYMQGIALSMTMGPGIKMDVASSQAAI